MFDSHCGHQMKNQVQHFQKQIDVSKEKTPNVEHIMLFYGFRTNLGDYRIEKVTVSKPFESVMLPDDLEFVGYATRQNALPDFVRK